MNLLITGVSSAIGQEICKKIEQEYNIIGWTRSAAKVKNKAIRVQEVDLFENDLPKIDDPIDIIIHIAAETPGSDYVYDTQKKLRFQRVNVDATQKLIEIAKHKNIKQIIYISSHAVDDFMDDKGSIVNAYAKSKWQAEELIKASGINYTIFRPSGIYGDTPYWRNYLSQLKTTKKIILKGDASQKLQYINIKDFVHSITSCLDNSNAFNKLFRIGGGDIISKYKYYQILRAYTSSSFKIIKIHYFLVYGTLSILSLYSKHYKKTFKNVRHSRKDLTVNNNLVIKTLNYTPRTFIQGIKDVKI